MHDDDIDHIDPGYPGCVEYVGNVLLGWPCRLRELLICYITNDDLIRICLNHINKSFMAAHLASGNLFKLCPSHQAMQ